MEFSVEMRELRGKFDKSSNTKKAVKKIILINFSLCPQGTGQIVIGLNFNKRLLDSILG